MGGESCTVFRLRLMHMLAMHYIQKMLQSLGHQLNQKINIPVKA